MAVSEYFTANQECRVLCEGAYNYDGYNYMEYSADLFQTITGETQPVWRWRAEATVLTLSACVRSLHAGAEL